MGLNQSPDSYTPSSGLFPIQKNRTSKLTQIGLTCRNVWVVNDDYHAKKSYKTADLPSTSSTAKGMNHGVYELVIFYIPKPKKMVGRERLERSTY